jgi:long-chain fatty acid transport protein
MGWLIGATLRPTEKLGIGISYRSEIDHEIEGTADWTVPGNVAAVLGQSPTTRPLFQDGRASADLTTPSVMTVSVSYQFTDQFTLLADYSETGWKSLQQINIDFANPDPNSVENFHWDDTRFYSLGGEYKFNDAWTFRAGWAYDETPTTFATRTPRLPDEDRTWYSVGASWMATQNLEVNFAYTYLDVSNPQIGLRDGGHTLFGEYDANINLYGVSAKYNF